MAHDIIHKNSTVAGTPPTAVEVELGEIAINAADAELYVKDANGNIRKFQNTTTGTADGVKFTQAGTGAVQRTVESKLQDVVSVKDFGAVGDGVTDDTAAIQAALDAHNNVHIPAGIYRADSSIIIDSSYQNPKSLTMSGATSLRRLAAYSSSQEPVIELIGNYGSFDGGFGEILSENDSPRGVVCLGHRDTTGALTTKNGLFWTFCNVDVRCKTYNTAPAADAVIGVYVPSSQPVVGSAVANYYGTVSNVRVYGAGTSYKLTDTANAHTFVNCSIEFFWHYGWDFRGAYGNTIYGGFINGCYQNGGTAIHLGNKLQASAPHAASHQSNNNNIYGVSIELYTSGNHGVYIPAGVGGYDSTHNFVQISWNSSGTPVTDLTTNKANTIFDQLTTLRLGYNLEIPDSTLSGLNLLKVGNNSYLSSHCIARTPPAGGTVLIVENNSTTNQPNAGLEVVNNTPVIGWNSYQYSAYHAPTSATVYGVYDNGDVVNTNNSYGPISSDQRLKQDITDARSQWDDIKNIRITNFRYKNDPTSPLQIGPIAQELELVSPGLITRRPASEGEIADPNNTLTDGDEVLSFKSSVLYMKAVKALQEAIERIENLESKVATLEAS